MSLFLAEFLVERCWKNTKLAVALHWSMLVDCDDPEVLPTISSMQSHLYGSLLEKNRYGHDAINGQMRLKAFLDRFGKEVCLFHSLCDAS